jgi:hypothetical protein
MMHTMPLQGSDTAPRCAAATEQRLRRAGYLVLLLQPPLVPDALQLVRGWPPQSPCPHAALQSVRGRMLEGRPEELMCAKAAHRGTTQLSRSSTAAQTCCLMPPGPTLWPHAALQSVRGRMLEGRTEELMGLAKAVYRGRQAEGRPGSRSDASPNTCRVYVNCT